MNVDTQIGVFAQLGGGVLYNTPPGTNHRGMGVNYSPNLKNLPFQRTKMVAKCISAAQLNGSRTIVSYSY